MIELNHPSRNMKREVGATTSINHLSAAEPQRPEYFDLYLDTSPSVCSDITTDTGLMLLYGYGCDESPSAKLEFLLQEMEEGDELLDQTIRSMVDFNDMMKPLLPSSRSPEEEVFTENFHPNNKRNNVTKLVPEEPPLTEKRAPLQPTVEVPSSTPTTTTTTKAQPEEPNHAKHSRSIPIDQMLSTITSKRRADRIKLAKHSKTIARLHRARKLSNNSVDNDNDHEPLLLKINSIPSVASTEPCSSRSSSSSSRSDNSIEESQCDDDEQPIIPPPPLVRRSTGGAVKRRIGVPNGSSSGVGRSGVPLSYRKWQNCFQSKTLNGKDRDAIPKSYRKWRQQYQHKQVHNQIYCYLDNGVVGVQ